MRDLETLCKSSGHRNFSVPSRYFRLYEQYVKCSTCGIGKQKMPVANDREWIKATQPGQILHIDIVFVRVAVVYNKEKMNPVIELSGKHQAKREIGVLMAVDEKTRAHYIVPLTGQATRKLEVRKLRVATEIYDALNKVFTYFKRKPDELWMDADSSIEALEYKLAITGIKIGPAPAGQHNKLVEANVGPYRAKERCVIAEFHARGLVFPLALIPYLWMDMANRHNQIPNDWTGLMTPLQVIHEICIDHARPDLMFGEIVIWRLQNGDNRDDFRGEMGMCIGKHPTHYQKYLAYMPKSGLVKVMYQHVPVRPVTTEMIRVFNDSFRGYIHQILPVT